MSSQRRNDWCDADSAQELFDRHPDLLRHPDSPGELQEDGTIVGGCPNWQDPKSVRVPPNPLGLTPFARLRWRLRTFADGNLLCAQNPVKINRKTLGWNGAAACFAYGYGKLALQGFKYVGDDQLIGGPVSCHAPS